MKLAGELIDVGVPCADGPKGDDLGAVITRDIGDRDGCFVDIQSNVSETGSWLTSEGVKLLLRHEAALASRKLTRVLHRRSADPSAVMMSRPEEGDRSRA